MKLKKTAILGGAFDPIHYGHILLAEQVYKKFNLDRLIFMPMKNPPHKDRTYASGEDRLNMVKIAIEKMDGNFQVSDMELKKNKISFTYDTLKEWRLQNPREELFFVTGSDIFATIETWHNWRGLFELAKFIVVNRPGMSFDKLFSEIKSDISDITTSADDFLATGRGKVILFEAAEHDISSTMIRNDIFNDASLVPREVLKYITEKGIYKGKK